MECDTRHSMNAYSVITFDIIHKISKAYFVSHTINICALHVSSLPSAGVKSHAQSLAAGQALSMKHVLEKAGTVPLA